MITIAKTKEKMMADPLWWKIALMDFVDDFRRHRDVKAIGEPFELSDPEKDAVLASVAETLCDEADIVAPEWLNDVPACFEPYFVSGIENLKATALVQSPARFRRRKVFVHSDFLSRV